MEEMQETKPVAEAAGGPTPKRRSGAPSRGARNRGRTIGLVLAAVLVLALIGAATYGLVTHPPFTSVLRDISIILLALVTAVIGLFLIILVFQLQSLIALLRNEIKPILESANDTANTVRGTTTFVSDAVVTPVIQAASFAAGVGQTLRVLTGSRGKRARRTTPAGPVQDQSSGPTTSE